MIDNKIVVGQIDIGIHPDIDYLSGLTIRLTTLDQEGRPYSAAKPYKSDLHGSQIASIISGPYYGEDLPQIMEIEAISIPRLGKTILCLLRALDAMLSSGIRILCMPIGVNLPTPVFLPFIKALTEQGVLIVVSSGNKGKGTVLSPGSYSEVLTVGALNMAGNIASYSGRLLEGLETGQKPDIFARGEFPDPADPDSGKTIHGTSMACAYMVGKAARIWQTIPKTTASEIWSKLDVPPPKLTRDPHFLGQPYIDNRLKTTLRQLDSNEFAEGIIISGNPRENHIEPVSIDQLLKDVEATVKIAPFEVNYFSIDNVIHLLASRQFFEALLRHKGMFCAQAVDVSMFDM